MIIAGNWKMNCNKEEAIKLVNEITKDNNIFNKSEVIIFPSYLMIHQISQIIENKNVKLGAQDCSIYDNGAYTGQVSSDMILDAGCEYVILGHSERRVLCNETSEDISKKFFQAFSSGLNSIICIGENLKERENNKYLSVLEEQIKISLSNIKEFEMSSVKNKVIIAYEPIWAIGTGKVATNKNIEEVHSFIKHLLKDDFKIGLDIPIIYGGSVNEDNSLDIFKIKNVDGVLVGGASLKSDSFLKIINNSL